MTERLRVNDVNDDADEPMARDDSRGEALDPLFDSDYAAQSRGRWQELQSRSRWLGRSPQTREQYH